MRNEEQALAIWRRIDQKRGLALSLNEMASAQDALGKAKEALANYQEALQLRRDIGDRRGLGDTLIDMAAFTIQWRLRSVLKVYKESLQLQRDLGNESMQAICLNNIGTVLSDKGQYEDALTYFSRRCNCGKNRNRRRTPWRQCTIWVILRPIWASTTRLFPITCEPWICAAPWMTSRRGHRVLQPGPAVRLSGTFWGRHQLQAGRT